MVLYTPFVWSSLRQNRFGRVEQLGFAVFLLFVSIALNRGWAAVYQAAGSPDSLLNHPIIGFITVVAISGATLYVTAPGYGIGDDEGHIGGRFRWWLLGAGAVGGITTLALSFAHGVHL